MTCEFLYQWILPFKYRLFELFVSILDLVIQKARKDGHFDSGTVDIRANTIELQGTLKVILLQLLSLALHNFFFNY